MAKASVSKSEAKGLSGLPRRLFGRLPLGSKLIGIAGVLFVITWIVRFLPLGLLGSWVNGFLYPILLVCLVAGVAITYRKAKA